MPIDRPCTLQEATAYIEDARGTPITAFLLISRACELAGQNVDPELVAHALDSALGARGWLAAVHHHSLRTA